MAYEDDEVEQMLSDLEESLRHSKALERECENLEHEIECLRQDLSYCLEFNLWLAKVYPNAEKEFSCVKDIERGV